MATGEHPAKGHEGDEGTGEQEAPAEHQEPLFRGAGAQALAEGAQRGGGASILGDIQRPHGCGHGQRALGGPA